MMPNVLDRSLLKVGGGGYKNWKIQQKKSKLYKGTGK